MFLMVAIPILVVLIVKLTANMAVGDVFISVQSVVILHDPIFEKVGTSVDLECEIYPKIATNKVVTWSSDNESVATVDMNGHVEFLDIGSGYISVTTQDGNMRAQCYYHVYDTVAHRVELYAPQDFVHIGAKEPLQLTATVLPTEAENQAVEFSSSDTSIATVDTNGRVTGLSEGYVTITVTTEDGGFTDSVDLLISKPVTALIVEESEIITSSKQVQVEYIIEPFYATNKNVIFEVDNPEIASVNNLGLITFLKPGEVNLTITTVDGGFERTIKYIYTAGYAYDLIVEQNFIDMQVDDVPVLIEYQTLPEFLDQELAQLEFVFDEENIAYVDKSGCLNAVKGGSTILRIRVHTSADTILERQIYINIKSPAEGIDLEDVITVERTVKLQPKSLPEWSTNEDYFYHIDEVDKATVSSDGVVEFLTDEPCKVLVVVYANKDYSTVSKAIYVTYTAGKASHFSLIDSHLTLDYGEKTYLQYDIDGIGDAAKPKLSIVSSNPVVADGRVVEIDSAGEITAIGGGTARIKAEVTLYDGRLVTQYCDVTVNRQAESIEIVIDEEYYNYQYVTGENIVKFSGKISPLDATEKDIIWSVNDKSIAFIDGDSLIFNRAGYVTLTATVGGISNSVEVFYTASNPVFGQVKAIIDDEKREIPDKISINDSFSVVIEKIIPQNIQNRKVYLQVTNQKTANATGVVLKIEDNRVVGVAGGTATLVVNISNSVRASFDILVERLPEKVTVLQADTQVQSDTVNLISTVSPIDATNQKVRYVVENEDVASVEDNILKFKKNGTAHIIAYCEANESISTRFSIEKVEKDIVFFTYGQKQISVNKGDVLAYELEENYSLRILQNNPIVSGEEVAIIEDKYIKTLSAGTAEIEVEISGQTFTIHIDVAQPVENISLASEIDMFNGEYVVAEDAVDLDFYIFPSYATNKEVKISFVQPTSIAYISGKTLYFISSGSVTVQACSLDGNSSLVMQIRNTGGDALDGILNVDDNLVMNIGQQITIEVTRWVPFDCKNKRIVLSEINSSAKKVIEINSKTNTITAVDSGQTKLVVQLSNGVVKEIEIVCLNKVTDIVVEENIVTASDTYNIMAEVLPTNATIKDLDFELEKTDIAILEGSTLHFSKAGTVYVIVRSTDGSEIEKRISVTSTMGYLHQIVLSQSEYKITKGQSISIDFEKYPLNATNNDVKFKIISQQAIDNSENEVIQIFDNGTVRGVYGGSAIVRIYATDYYGQEIFADCTVDVICPVESIDLQFETEMQNYQNQSTFITSQSEIAFKVVLYPQDATTTDYSYEISSSIAKIEGNKIIFLSQGRVSIKFTSADISLGQKSKTYSFYYVGQDIIEATLDKSQMQNNVIYLKAGESFDFKLDVVYPNDNKDIKFVIRDTSEKRNDINKQVAAFEDGTLYALNGGQFEFTLFANNLKLDTLTLIVTRDATDIVIEDDLKVYVSQPNYVIKAHALETDTHQALLGYKIEGDAVATVTPDGVVEFSELGKVLVTVYIVDNPSVSKTIEIVYTKQLQSIKFSSVQDSLYVGGYVDISVLAQPYDAEEFEYEISIDDEKIATLIKRTNGYRLVGSAEGEVTVTAKVKGRDIEVSKQFHVYNRIDDLMLELDNSADLNGHGQYRVFGNYFVNSKGEVVNTYQMNVSLFPEICSKDLLEYSSSNEAIATVDNDGIVTFLKTGKVTITVKQKVLYEGAIVASDSYDFTVVEGINVYNYQQFEIAAKTLEEINKDRKKDFAAIILQCDVISGEGTGGISFAYNLYGNGYALDFSKRTGGKNWSRFNISGKQNLVIDNVILRATSFSKAQELKATYTCVGVSDSSNILFYNTIIENAESGAWLSSASISFEGCIFRNCLKNGICINGNSDKESDVKVKDSIFTSSLCGIWVEMKEDENMKTSNLVLEGEVRFYNWSTLDQLEQGLDIKQIFTDAGVSFAADGFFNQVKDFVSKHKEFCYTYNGKDYYNLGVMRINVDALSQKFRAPLNMDRSKLNASCNYSMFNFSGVVNMVVTLPIEFSILSLSNVNPFIKPGDSYIGDTALLGIIRQACRF